MPAFAHRATRGPPHRRPSSAPPPPATEHTRPPLSPSAPRYAGAPPPSKQGRLRGRAQHRPAAAAEYSSSAVTYEQSSVESEGRGRISHAVPTAGRGRHSRRRSPGRPLHSTELHWLHAARRRRRLRRSQASSGGSTRRDVPMRQSSNLGNVSAALPAVRTPAMHALRAQLLGSTRQSHLQQAHPSRAETTRLSHQPVRH